MAYKTANGDEVPQVDAELYDFAVKNGLRIVNYVHIGDRETGEGGGGHLLLTEFLPRIGEKIISEKRLIGIVRSIHHNVIRIQLPSGASVSTLVPNVVLENKAE